MSYTTKGGNLSADETWTAGTYLLSNYVCTNTHTLTIDPTAGDVIIKCNNYGLYLTGLWAEIICIASSKYKIYLTSYNDDTVGEILPGSTGLPQRTDNTNQAISFGSSNGTYLTIRNMEIRYFHTAQGIVIHDTVLSTNNMDIDIDGLILKNCSATAANSVLIGDPRAGLSGCEAFKLKNIKIDNTNYVTQLTSSIIRTPLMTTTPDLTLENIYIEPLDAYRIHSLIYIYFMQLGTIVIKNIFLYGYCCDSQLRITDHALATNETFDISYIQALCKWGGQQGIKLVSLNGSHNFNIRNSIFKDFDNSANTLASGIYYDTTVNSLQDNHCGFFNNYFNKYKVGTGSIPISPDSFEADPELGDLPPDIEIAEDCVFPDGYARTNLDDYEENGDESFDTSGYDEATHTGTGKYYTGSDMTTPGIMYKVDPEGSPEISSTDFFSREPDWNYPVSLEYGFETSLYLNHHFTEQRRPLRDNPVRAISYTISDFSCKQEVENFINRFRNSYLNTPLFTEPLRVNMSGSLLGINSFILHEDIDYRFNALRFTDRVIFIDIQGIVSSVMMDVALMAGNSLITTSTLVAAFQAETTIIYPALLSVLDDVSYQDLTDDKIAVDVTFKGAR